MRFPFFFASITLLAAVAAACDGNVVVPTGGTGAGTTTSQAATSSSSSGAGGDQATTSSGAGGSGLSPAGCPPTAPAAGTSCTHETAICSFGDTPFAECRKVFECNQGTWGLGAIACPTPTPGCPSTEPPAQQPCDIMGDSLCGYPSGTICSCGSCPPASGICMPGPVVWFCQSPSGPSGCPQLIPNQGSDCSSANLTCNYPSAGCGVITTCTGGAWTWAFEACAG